MKKYLIDKAFYSLEEYLNTLYRRMMWGLMWHVYYLNVLSYYIFTLC